MRSHRPRLATTALALVVLSSASGCARTIERHDPADLDDAGASRSDGGAVLDGGGPGGGRGSETGGLADNGRNAPRDAAIIDGASLPPGPTFDMEFTITTRFGEPVEGARVRIDTADGSVVQGTADDRGRFTAALEETSAPWDVTVAREGFMSATTIVGVTGPIESPIHMAKAIDRTPETRSVSGSVTGLGPGANSVQLLGPGIADTMFSSADETYTATLTDDGSTSLLRLLAIETTSASTAPTNGAWIELDLGTAVLSGSDIVFSPPALRTSGTIVIEMPTVGALDATGYVMESAFVRLIADDFEYGVGKVGDVSLVSGRFDCTIDALGGELAPTDVEFEFTGGDGLVFVEVAADSDAVVVLPAADELSSPGDSLADVRLTLRADEYAHVGASAQSSSGRATWFVYSYTATEIVDKPWPRLPAGVSFADLDIGASGSQGGTVNVFAVTREDSSKPWDWRRAHRERALIKSREYSLSGR